MKGVWLRTDWDDAPWLAGEAPEVQLAWIKLLAHIECYGAQGETRPLSPLIACRRWGVPAHAVEGVVRLAREAGALADSDGAWRLATWDNRGPTRRSLGVSLRAEIMARDGGECCYCGGEAEHVDHVLPVSRGGSDDPSNLVAACAPCNLSKGALTPEEWGGRDAVV